MVHCVSPILSFFALSWLLSILVALSWCRVYIDPFSSLGKQGLNICVENRHFALLPQGPFKVSGPKVHEEHGGWNH